MKQNEASESESKNAVSFITHIIAPFIDLRFIKLIPGLRSHVTKTFASALVSSSASILLLFCVSLFVSGLIDGKNLENLLFIFVAMVCMLLLRLGAEIIRERSACTTAGVMKQAIRSQMYQHLLLLGPEYTDKNESGAIATTFVDGTEQLEQYVAYYIPYIILCILVPSALFVGFALLVDLITALILLAFAPFVPLMIMFSNRRRRIEKGDVWREFRDMSSYYSESIQGLPTLKLFNQHIARAEKIRALA